MDRDIVLAILSKNHQLLQDYGVKDIRLFGSVARGEAGVGSDVDLLVEFEPSAHTGMFEFSRLRRDLSRLLGCEVDLATPDALHRMLKEDILREAIRAA
jgi:predicted nucleotidyltransferase